jgi:hypothetical protein
MRNLKILPYQESDFIDFQNYINSAFNSKYILGEQKFLKWQYKTGELYLAKSDDKIIGHFGFRSIPYKVYDKTFTVRVLMNLFTLESYRSIGVGTMLAKIVFDTLDPILVSGYTPLAQKLFSHISKDWKQAGNLSRYFIILNTEDPIFAGYKIISRNKKNLSDFKFEIKDSIPSDIDIENFWVKIRDNYKITVERTPDYLKWRFFNNPFLDYKILTAYHNGNCLGFLIYRCEESGNFKIFRVIDFISEEKSEKLLLLKFLEIAKKEKASAADFMFSGSFYKKSLEDTGFFDNAGTDFEFFPILFNPISAKKTFINIAYDLKTTLNDCYFTKADGDQDRFNAY